jgi:hypothetical protein
MPPWISTYSSPTWSSPDRLARGGAATAGGRPHRLSPLGLCACASTTFIAAPETAASPPVPAASRQTTGKPSHFISCQCQCQFDNGPLSRPTRTTLDAFARMAPAIASGVGAYLSCQSVFPPRSTTQIDVRSSETSSPTHCPMSVLLSFCTAGSSRSNLNCRWRAPARQNSMSEERTLHAECGTTG